MAAAAEDRTIDDVVTALHAEATRRTGLVDFGQSDYREAFSKLAALPESPGTPPLNAVGLHFLREELIGALTARLIREDQWRKNPSYRSRSIDRPVIICGIPRTGTTVLHKVLSVDPQFQGLDHWLTSWPKPRPPRAQWKDEPGFLEAVEVLRKRYEYMPDAIISHEVVADEVDECLEVLRLDFVSNRFASMFNAPEFDAWFQAQDETPAYRRLADTLRLIGLHDERTWLLKNPGHIAEMEALLTVFPDARVIITHRDPVKSLPSIGSVLSETRKAFYDDPDLTSLGPRELDYWSKAKARTEAFRRTQSADQFIDVDHRQFHADPIGVVRTIYDRFGLELSSETEQAMRVWLAANPAGKHGEHRYQLADYGLTEDGIRTALGDG